ncbi:MAG: hypothetical protein M3459_11725 [Actinomycetota bacterium]|nr:hypothetical protein [Actinomycetota bacterium]
MSRAHARVVSLLAALTVGVALPAGAVAQTAAPQLPGLSEEPPPWEGEEAPDGSEPGGEEPGGNGGSGGGEPSGEGGEGGGSEPSGTEGDAFGSTDGSARPAADELPRTGSEPLLLGLSGVALALLGTGLRLRTLDADVF